MKNYTLKQASVLNKISYQALRKQVERDSHAAKQDRKYPNAYKCECGHSWLIPACDLKINRLGRVSK